MPKKRSNDKNPLTPQEAHQRTVKAWVTKHAKYHYGINRMVGPDDEDQVFEGDSGFHEDDPGHVDEEEQQHEKSVNEWIEGHENESKQTRREKLRRHAQAEEEQERRNKMFEKLIRDRLDSQVVVEKQPGKPDRRYHFKPMRKDKQGRTSVWSAEEDPSKKIVLTYPQDVTVEDLDAEGITNYITKRIVVVKNTKVVPSESARQAKPQIPKHSSEYERTPHITVDDYYDYKKKREDREGKWNTTLHEAGEQRSRSRKAYQEGNLGKGYSTYTDEGRLKPKQTSLDKADFGLRPTKDTKTTSIRWELMDPEDRDRWSSDQLHFQVSNKPLAETAYDPEAGRVTVQGEELRQVLAAAGLGGADIQRNEVTDAGNNTVWDYTITTREGRRINPGHAALVGGYLDQHYGINRDEKGQPVFERIGPPMQRVVDRRPLGSPPTKMNPEDVWNEQTVDAGYHGRISTKLGNRNSKGELKEGEHDTIALRGRLPGQKQDQAAFINLKERSDAVGWGKSYRPGEKEVGDVLLAYPRAQEKHKLDELALQHQTTPENQEADYSELDKFIKDKYPDANQDQIHHLRHEFLELGSASAAAGYYTTKKAVRQKGVYKALRKVAPVRRLDDKYGVFPYFDEAYARPVGQKYDRAWFRIAHPLRDPMNPQGHGVEFDQLKPELPSIRYRSRGGGKKPLFMKRETFDERLQERSDKQIQSLALARSRVRDQVLADPEQMSRLQRIDRHIRLRTSRGLLQKSQEVGFDEKAAEIGLPKGINPHYEQSAVDNVLKNEHIRPVGAIKPSAKFMGKGLLGAAVVGAGIYEYDKHHQNNSATTQEKPNNLWQKLPETVNVPQVKAKRTRTWTIPKDSSTADFLDIGGKEIPVAWRVSVKNKHYRIRNHKDISGEGYKSGQPIVGKVGTAPVENDGSWQNSMAYTTKTERGRYMPSENTVEVAGHNTPFFVDLGEKDRWNKRGGKKSERLTTKNKNKLSQDEREKIALLMHHGSVDADKLDDFYHDDEKIQKLRRELDEAASEGETHRIERKHNQYYLSKRTPRREVTRLDEEGEPIPIGDTPGRFLTEPEFDSTTKPFSQDAFYTSRRELKDRENDYRDQVEREQMRQHDTFDRTYQQLGGEGAPQYSSRPGGVQRKGKDTPAVQTERKQRGRQRSDQRYERRKRDSES